MRRALLLALGLAAIAACALFAEPEDPRLAPWKTQASALRGLQFETPVRLAWVSQAQIPGVIRGELEELLTPEDARRYRDAYAALGVLPPEIDFVETMLALQSQMLAGLYSPRRRTLYVLDSLRDDPNSASPGQSLIVVHELVHALQDQHAPQTLALLTGLRRQDDVVGALSAVLEGDATLTMLGAGAAPGDADKRNERTAAVVHEAMLAQLAHPDGEMAAVPRLLRESLLFPYAFGTPLSARRFAAAGNIGLDAALRDPPLSTLRVLVPDDTDPVEFIRLPEAALAQRLAERGCLLGDDNVAGAVTLGVLFEDYGGALDLDTVLRGWSGDRFLQIDCAGTWELVWLTRWESDEAAARFAAAYRAIAPAVGANAPLSGPPEAVLRGRTALVLTPGVRAHAEWLFDASEIRAYSRFSEWLADGCFPETPCPDEARN